MFFGSLIPLALQHQSSLSFPLLYGTGSGLPVLLFAVLMSGGMQSVSKAFRRLTQVELWMRRATGSIFIAVGIYYSLASIFNLLWLTASVR